ncbi:MAG: DUF4352 domain-containing protein [Mycobacterium sp.]|nr:DUF4352 domain-containing protein [Mycobacterium sp.]
MSQPPPAPGWYPDPSGTGSRYWDGKGWGPAAPPSAPTPAPARPKKRVATLLIVVAVLAVLFIIGKIGYNSGSTSRSSSTTTMGAMPPPPPAAGGTAPSATTSAPPPLAGIGQEVRDGNFGFVVTSVDLSKTAGDPGNQFEIVPAQGEFVNVHLTVSNVGDRSQSFFASNQTLQIGANQFSSNNAATMWTQSMKVEINPGNSIQAVVSFDVPPGSSNDGVLTVHGSPFSGGAKISLRQPGR